MVLKLKTSESKIRNALKVLKCGGAREGSVSSAGQIMWKKNHCVESRRKGTSYTQLKKRGYLQRDSFLKHVIDRKTEVTSKEGRRHTYYPVTLRKWEDTGN